jgi:general secretion pathway protein L
MIKRILAFWIDGLATALVQVRTLMRRPQRFQLRGDSHSLTLYNMRQPEPKAVYAFKGQDVDTLPESLQLQTRGCTVEIPVPTAAFQERRLEVLPAESLPYIENIVFHQIESLFPWPSSDVLHSIKINKRADGKLDVLVRATSRSPIARALDAAAACGAFEILVVDSGEDPHGGRGHAILASVGREKAAQQRRARLISQYAVVGLIGIAACVAGWTTFIGWNLEGDIAALEQTIDDRRAIIKRSSSPVASTQYHDLAAKKKITPLAVVVLDELSFLLPDDTYLTNLSLEAGRLRISGVTTNAAALVPLLEGSGHFQKVSFAAPATRIVGSQTDRFSIEAAVISP